MEDIDDVLIRGVMVGDAYRGLVETLENMSMVGGLNILQAAKAIEQIQRNPVYRMFVAVKNELIVGSITLLIEQKLIHEASRAGHIEDMSVHKNHTGQGIGTMLMEKVLEEARKAECYKVILNCKESLIPFYERFGFEEQEVQMRLDLDIE